MQRFLKTLVFCLSVLILLAVNAVQHHHHHGVPCVVMERCEQDHTYNDKHTHHVPSHEDHSSCIKNASMFIQKSSLQNYLVQAKFSSILIAIIDLSDYYDADKTDMFLYKKYQNLYQSAILQSINSLRAPPCLFEA